LWHKALFFIIYLLFLQKKSNAFSFCKNLSECLMPCKMKLKSVLINLFLCFSFMLPAQESQNDATETAGFKTPFVRNSAGSNWFTHLGAGVQTIFGDYDNKTNIPERITFFPTLSAGKWISPYWGFRLKGQGGPLHKLESDGVNRVENRYYNIHLDALWNIANYWGVYSPQKSFHMAPYIGLGYGRRLQPKNNIPADALLVNGGFRFGFRLNKRIHLDFDLGLAVAPDYFDGMTAGTQNDLIAALSGGLTFNLGKTTFDPFIPYNAELVTALNEEVNKLRKDNRVLSKRPGACPECPESPNVNPEVSNEINLVPNVVFFRLNSAKVNENQQLSIYNTAEFLKSYGEKVRIVGYADRQTGTDAYNLKLSEKRAKAVAKELVSKYNIPSQKIVIEWKGSEEQPYPENNWNRVVIMTVE
jgi:outer membrane protein OmpA-like peptidoglycan-associated protein